jgi:hypothetical protein
MRIDGKIIADNTAGSTYTSDLSSILGKRALPETGNMTYFMENMTAIIPEIKAISFIIPRLDL